MFLLQDYLVNYELIISQPTTLNEYKSRSLVQLACCKCNQPHFRTKHAIQIAINSKGYTKNFCSIKCHNEHIYGDTRFDFACVNCTTVFTKIKSSIEQNNFCSSSCAATHINKYRTLKPRQKKEPKPRIYKAKLPKPPKTRTCTDCGKFESIKAGWFQSPKCSFCSDSLTYRTQCKFTFNLKDYPMEFDFSLLETHGMFNPKSNPTGVSRDHMLSVNFGKINKIDASIISHPANCLLMTQADNTRKQSNCSITLNDLLEKIKQWDLKYQYSLVA